MRRWRLGVLVGAVAVGLAASVYLAMRSGSPLDAATANVQEEGGAIFFLRTPASWPREERIGRYDVPTGKVHILTREPVRGGAPPSPSPDGTKVAFIRQDTVEAPGSTYHVDVANVCVLDTLSGGIRNLTMGPVVSERLPQWQKVELESQACVTGVAWSPDGKYIAFSSHIRLMKADPGGSFRDHRIYVIGADGSNPRELLNMDGLLAEQLPEGFAGAKGLKLTVLGLEWYGPGSRMLRIRVWFERGSESGDYESKEVSYLAGLDEEDLSLRSLQLIPEPKEPGGMPWFMVRHRQWSPDGRRLAYTVRSEKASPMAVDALYVVDADGVSNNTLVYKGGPETIIDSFAWSPTGKYLVLEIWGGRGYAGLYAVSVEGGKLVAITRGGWRTIDEMPTWVACPPLPDSP